MKIYGRVLTTTMALCTLGLSPQTALAQGGASCQGLPRHAELKAALTTASFSGVVAANNRGFGNHMWATVVDRDGEVCAVVFTGADRGDQWPGSRVISLTLTARRSAISGGSGVLSRRHGTIFRESPPTACMIALWSSWRTQSDRLASADHSKTKASNAANPSLSFPGMESPACISHSSNQTSRPLRTMCAPTERANPWSALL